MFPSPSRKGRSSPSSGRTGRENPPPCGPSPGWSALSPGASSTPGKPIAGLPSHRIARLGILHVPGGSRRLRQHERQENLEMRRTRSSRNEVEAAKLEQVFGLFPRLAERARPTARTLSGGAADAGHRGLVQRPDLLLLDEPSMGCPHCWWARSSG